jgi:hypothetical protein
MRWISPILGALVVLGSSSAFAQTVEDGRQAYLEAEFEGALAAFEGVLASPDLEMADAIEATRYLTALELMLGHERLARGRARAAVALDPDVRAPEGSPPEADALLREMAAEIDGAAELEVRSEGGARISARLSPVPEGVVTALTLRCADEIEEGEPPAIFLTSSASDVVDCEAEALTDAGAALYATAETLTLGDEVSGTTTDEEDGEGAPLWPWLVAGGGALIAVGIVITVVLIAASGGGDQAAFGGTRVEGW